ncbi:tetraacyldisaccharide 4'-kinase [Campylobacter ureolyticus]|uniref:tetraacyldisaccharide 4'-kinase n=1 Tax=Campylobacter ureolyticus TaxID=827 RepID=UPI001FC8B5A7|nr:tetraacyldisaccharide 4'-kinase [Campylobacter ureolyticus]MCZ6132646.1 tetraacyldisaccharide 4'-kinase [Campylobacter ureolyticus]GKH60428.1 tetraacyldisaccharide 4'-kinase [Campylobacter ureolyticus]
MSKKIFHNWVNKYFYSPNFWQKFVSKLLLPLSYIYAFIVIIKKILSKEKDFDVKIISVGNLIVGGSGKTPLTLALYKHFSKKYKTFIILRGYKRSSKGLVEVCIDNKILVDVKQSGDEAMEYALNNANVIVSENRINAIQKAKSLGANLIILDDGFSKFNIKKFNILLKPPIRPYFNFTLPSGAYRYPLFFYKFGDFIVENSENKKHSFIENETKNMVLVTAIANPKRLKEHFNKCVGKEFFPDHHAFNKFELEEIIKKYNATSLLVTMKDYVKIKDFGLPTSIIKLEISLSQTLIKAISNYIK